MGVRGGGVGGEVLEIGDEKGEGTFLCHDGWWCEGRMVRSWFDAGSSQFVVSAEMYASQAQG